MRSYKNRIKSCFHRSIPVLFFAFALLFFSIPGGIAAHSSDFNRDNNRFPSRYGKDDQIGTLNEITPEKIVRATRLVKNGQVYDLGRVVEDGIPAFGIRYFKQTLVSSSHIINSRGKTKQTAPSGMGDNKINWITEIMSGTFQLGTQLDGLNHLQIGNRFYNGWTTQDIVEEWGTSKLGIETVPPIITRGVLLDIAALKGVERLNKGYVITVGDINAAAEREGITIEPGDAVLFHTGWGSLWMKDNEKFNSGEPGPGMAAAKYLVEKRVAIARCDTWSFGPVPPENPKRPFEVPQTLNVKHGMFIMEILVTENLAKDKVYEFMFVLTHHKTRGSTAAMIAPAAVR